MLLDIARILAQQIVMPPVVPQTGDRLLDVVHFATADDSFFGVDSLQQQTRHDRFRERSFNLSVHHAIQIAPKAGR